MLKLVGLLALVSVAFAAVSRFPPEEKPAELANQEGCYISKFNRVVAPGTVFYPNTDCALYRCPSSDNDTLYETCGAIAIRDGCRKSVQDNSKQYPDCCSKEICDATPIVVTKTEECGPQGPS